MSYHPNGTYTIWEDGAYTAIAGQTWMLGADIWSRTASSNAAYTSGIMVRGRIYSSDGSYDFDDTHWPSYHAITRANFTDTGEYRLRFTFAANNTNTTSAWDWEAATFTVGDSAPMPVTTTTYTTPAVSVDAADYSLILKIASTLPTAPASTERWVEVVVTKVEFIATAGDEPELDLEVYDPFDPDADAPAVPEPECSSVLDLIREFSGLVRRAVRITGPSSISMVDPNAPLPAGYTADDAAGMYHQTQQQLSAGTVVLSLLAGKLGLALSADLVSDDARILTSGWRIPDRLPVYTIAPTAVQRVNYQFTPRGFQASLEFRAASVPLSVRR